MKAIIFFFCLFPLLLGAQDQMASSVGGRVTIYGGNSNLRVAMVQDADVLVRSLDELVGALSKKPIPIFVQLYPAVSGEPSRMSRQFYTVGSEKKNYRLQIDLTLGRGNSFDQKNLERLMLQMLLIERTLRELPEGETADRAEIRPWLLDGLAEAMAWRKDRGDRRMYASLMESGGWIEAEKLVDRTSLSGLNVLSRELFRASSGALVMALLSQPQGQSSMSAFLSKVAVFEGEQLTLVRTHFPQVNLGQKSLERWWMLQVAAMSEKKLTEAMSIPETDERLQKVLEFHLKDSRGRALRVGFDSWRMVADLKTIEERMAAARPAADLLAHLSFRCFPTYRPVIGGYIQILSDLVKGDTDKFEEVMGNLETYREAEKQRYTQLIDLMNWYHLANVKEEKRGEFSDYLRVRENLRRGSEGRKDPINRYLDQAQKLFEARQGS